ncbi:MAG TPA: DUF429 domain-containing protein [Polyangiaceae bacterium LLY-WYZ-15_(1-7)]|nr:hypothetical protein [Myxococcales bacterium]MAT24847.1 hypothetical protein [Sandaracinus sp.]HJK93347.1 DUF429 domain-containing protein [Polyangiaceae bacterium LLY-WYZ-15_(1-7)]MBJ74201.1 hypothetical protein [Sandaracinus sp.]HJL02372.1 DUF429 domain-containing protein [Polyangiaceae bacterium LLY-WYZ-15_(1-7)]
MRKNEVAVLGIDPGTSKSWSVVEARAKPGASLGRLVPEPMEAWPHDSLEEGVEQVEERARDHACLLVIDAPLRFPRTLAEASFVPDEQNAHYPFDVNPFSTRPCERALRGKPRRKTLHESVRGLEAALQELRAEAKKRRSTWFRHAEGVSVQPFMQAPHGPIVDAFLVALRDAGLPVELSLEAMLSGSWEKGRVYVAESHPAVSMAMTPGVEAVPKYKGGSESVKNLVKQLGPYASSVLAPPHPELHDDDDELDAFVSALNGVSVVLGRADVFGTDEHGYFLVPQRESGPAWRDLWREAADGLPTKTSTSGR